MAQWLRMLLAGGTTAGGQRLLSAKVIAELFAPQTMVGEDAFYPTMRLTRPHWTTYGLGWFQSDYAGEKVDFHTGSIDGMVAIAGLIRDRGLGVYVLANLDHAELRHALMYKVFDLYLGRPPRDWSADLRGLYDGLAKEAAGRRAKADGRTRDRHRPDVAARSLCRHLHEPDLRHGHGLTAGRRLARPLRRRLRRSAAALALRHVPRGVGRALARHVAGHVPDRRAVAASRR